MSDVCRFVKNWLSGTVPVATNGIARGKLVDNVPGMAASYYIVHVLVHTERGRHYEAKV
jgi:hypothetical protein